jgi:bifunctional DNA-binding transcriptional regulator/antitoxin component of YhaV-PrlF toxin-antitoxin module
MKSMLCRIITVGMKGEVDIPSEMRTSLEMKPGARIRVTQDGTKLILEAVSEELIDQIRGIFTDEPSLFEELKRQRQSKDAC